MRKHLLLMLENKDEITLGNAEIIWYGSKGFEMIGNPDKEWYHVYLLQYKEDEYYSQVDEFKKFSNLQLFAVSPNSRLKSSMIKFLMNFVFRLFPLKLERIPFDDIKDNLTSPIAPNEKSVQRLIDHDNGNPIVMLNLLKYYEKAQYGTDENVTGAVAYNRYGKHAVRAVSKIGGQLEIAGKVDETLIGNANWDEFAFMRYNTHDRFITMMTLKENKSALVHRNAGLEATLLVALADPQ